MTTSIPSYVDPIEARKMLVRARVIAYNNITDEPRGYDCPLCRNKGMIDIVDEDGMDDHFIDCECLPIRQALKKQTGLESLLAKYNFANYKCKELWQTRLRDNALRYADNPEGWFFVGGNVGSGKTHICVAILGRMSENGMPIQYCNWREMSTILKANVNNEAYANLIYPYKAQNSLLIDDFFKGDVTPADIKLAYEILNFRYVQGYPTIISSEHRLGDIVAIDEAIGSRIVELIKGNSYKVNANNMRLQGDK